MFKNIWFYKMYVIQSKFYLPLHEPRILPIKGSRGEVNKYGKLCIYQKLGIVFV